MSRVQEREKKEKYHSFIFGGHDGSVVSREEGTRRAEGDKGMELRISAAACGGKTARDIRIPHFRLRRRILLAGSGFDVLLESVAHRYTDRRNRERERERETHEDEMIVISNPIGAEPTKQTGPDVV